MGGRHEANHEVEEELTRSMHRGREQDHRGGCGGSGRERSRIRDVSGHYEMRGAAAPIALSSAGTCALRAQGDCGLLERLVFHGMPQDTAQKICHVMQLTGRAPEDIVNVRKLEDLFVRGENGQPVGVWRVGLTNMAKPDPPPSDLLPNDQWTAKVYHGTNVRGLHGILQEGKLLASAAGAGAHGVYARGHLVWSGQNEEGDRKACVMTVFNGSKSGSGVMFEALVEKRAFKSLRTGGIEAEAETVTVNLFTHFKSSKENRWCAHQNSLGIVAAIFREDLIVE